VKSSLRHDFLRITFTLGTTRTWGLIDARVSCQVFVVMFTLQKLLIDKTRNDEPYKPKLIVNYKIHRAVSGVDPSAINAVLCGVRGKGVLGSVAKGSDSTKQNPQLTNTPQRYCSGWSVWGWRISD